MQPVLPSLSPEEALILSALEGGLTNEAISSLYGLDIETVQSRSRAMMTKLHARSRPELMKAASDLIETAALGEVAPGGESAPSGLRRLAWESGEIDAAITRNIRRRLWVTASSAFVSGILSVITPIWPKWIEWIFGSAPDNGDSYLEWAIVICLVTTTTVLSFVAVGEWRRIPHKWQS
jgi:DNA-binding CsgD family transcriptional regulator